MNRLTACGASLAAAILSFAPNAHATPITYEISSVASGQIGATTFTNAEVDLIGRGNTANVTSFVTSGITIFANPFNNFTVTIAGIGAATITDLSEIWAIPIPTAGLSNVPLVVMGRIDMPPALDSITGIGLVGSNTLAGYEGSSGIGPITDEGAVGFPVGCSTPGHDPCVHTTRGLLSFTANLAFPETTQGTFTATLNPVPEPATLFLLGSAALWSIAISAWM